MAAAAGPGDEAGEIRPAAAQFQDAPVVQVQEFVDDFHFGAGTRDVVPGQLHCFLIHSSTPVLMSRP